MVAQKGISALASHNEHGRMLDSVIKPQDYHPGAQIKQTSIRLEIEF